jgi:hypothetical protein
MSDIGDLFDPNDIQDSEQEREAHHALQVERCAEISPEFMDDATLERAGVSRKECEAAHAAILADAIKELRSFV